MNYLVFDVGGSAIKYALMNDEFELLEKGSVPTPLDSFESFKNAIVKLYEPVRDRIEGIAMSLPGMINRQSGKMQIPGFLLYNQGRDVLNELKAATMANFTINNDAKCAALCEAALGSLKDCEVGAVCILGSGVGGAVTVGRHVFGGVHGFAGEFSYLSGDWQHFQGFNDKWGYFGSVNMLIAKVAAAKGIDANTLDGRKVFALCNEHDEQALACLREYCDVLAVGLYNLQACYDPQRIAIGGGISQQPILLDYLKQSLAALYQQIPFDIPRVELVHCEYYNDSNLIGALVHYFNEKEQKNA